LTTETKLLWRLRRQIVARLSSAPPDKRAALEASLRGIDLLLRESTKNVVASRFRFQSRIERIRHEQILNYAQLSAH
jgi:hypothetical protein